MDEPQSMSGAEFFRDTSGPPDSSPPPSAQPSVNPAQQINRHHRIVIVGGGAGGLELATQLGNKYRKSQHVQIVLVDRAATHLWKPLLHEVAAGSIDVAANQLEYVAQARWHHFEFQQGDLIGLDRPSGTITVSSVRDREGIEILPQRALSYDTLILAIGSTTNFFNTPGTAEFAIAVDTVDEAEHFRRRLVAACMRAQNRLGRAAGMEHPEVRIAVIGGGATGVELSAELRGTAQVLGAYGLHNLDPVHDIRITIIEAGPRILGPLPEHVAQETAAMLHDLNIDIQTGDHVTALRQHEVVMASGKVVPADLTVWAAGIQVAQVLGNIGLPVNKMGQVIVGQTLQTEIDPNIFAFGDCASCPWPATGKTVPPRAQAAHQQAKYLYRALQRHLDGKPLPSFVFHDRGSLISLGRFNTVGILMGKLIGKSLLVEGTLARLLYFSLYRMHQLALHGFMRMALDTLAHWLRRQTAPRVKLH